MSEWISVEDRLPDAETDVWVVGVRYDNALMYCAAGMFNGDWCSQETEDHVKFSVTHWMPLPEPPSIDGEK